MGPNQEGAAPIAAQGPGLPVCLLQLFKLLHRARARATFGKQLLISSKGVLFPRGLGSQGLQLAPRPRGTSAHLTPPCPGPREEGQQCGPGERGNSGRKPSSSCPAPSLLLLPLTPVLSPYPCPALGLCRAPRALALPPGPCARLQALAPPLAPPPMPLSRLWPLPLALALSPPLSSCPVPRSLFRPQGAGAGRTKAGLPLQRAGYLLVPGCSD